MKLIYFLRLTHKRFVAKSPTYFKVVTNVSLFLALVTGIPQAIEYLGLEMPPEIMVVCNKVVTTATAVAAIIAKLTVDDSQSLK